MVVCGSDFVAATGGRARIAIESAVAISKQDHRPIDRAASTAFPPMIALPFVLGSPFNFAIDLVAAKFLRVAEHGYCAFALSSPAGWRS